MSDSFPQILCRLRKERRLNQRTAAADLHISQALLSHYENGLREPGLQFVDAACRYYGVSADYLLGRSPVRTAFLTEELSPAQARTADAGIQGLRALVDGLEGASAPVQDSAMALTHVFFYELLRPFTRGRELPEEEATPLGAAALALLFARFRRQGRAAGLEMRLPEAVRREPERLLAELQDSGEKKEAGAHD